MLGMSHEGKRDLYASLGYPKEITPEDYRARYKRQDIANAVITRPVTSTWFGDVMVSENNQAEETQLEKAYAQLEEDLSLKAIFSRADKFTGLGRYGIILLGFSDVTSKDIWSTPVVKTQGLRLMYVRAFTETNAPINQFETEYTNPRYGEPLTYSIKFEQETLNVHHSRVIHIVEDPEEYLYKGVPRLEKVYNRLMDVEKLAGGSAEMYWRGARPGYTGKVDKDYTMGVKEQAMLQTQIDEYEHNLRRFLLLEGVDVNSLASQVTDPANHLDIQLSLISAATSIPKRMLMGSELGELASTADRDNWSSFISTRRTDFAEPCIVKPFVKKMIDLGILPTPINKNYSIQWTELFSQSEKERVDVGKVRTSALKDYASEPNAENIIPPEAFFEMFLGLSKDQIDLITSMYEQMKVEDTSEETPE